MAEWEECGRLLVGLAGELTNNVTRGLPNVGQSFTNQLAGLSTVISAQEVSQVEGSFDGEPTIFGDWNKSVETQVSCLIRFCPEVSLIHTRVYNTLKEKP